MTVPHSESSGFFIAPPVPSAGLFFDNVGVPEMPFE